MFPMTPFSRYSSAFQNFSTIDQSKKDSLFSSSAGYRSEYLSVNLEILFVFTIHADLDNFSQERAVAPVANKMDRGETYREKNKILEIQTLLNKKLNFYRFFIVFWEKLIVLVFIKKSLNDNNKNTLILANHIDF
nr:protein F41H10.9 [imported] - Caenorhabditis elegans [Caenorhabditis elegans]